MKNGTSLTVAFKEPRFVLSPKKIKKRKSPDSIPSKNLKKEMEKRNKLRSTYFLNKTEENKKHILCNGIRLIGL